jgi:hypothetical protein
MQFPHCDGRILHAPGVCTYCDMHPEWQELRLAWGINFTGEEHEYTKHIREELKDVEEGRLPRGTMRSWESFQKFKDYVESSKEHYRMLPCPAMYNRSQQSLDSWGGNVPRKTINEPKEK